MEEAVGGRSRWRTIRAHAVLAVLGVACVFPIYWMYASSVRQPNQVYSLAPFPWPLSVQNYVTAAHQINLAQLVLNTFLMALFAALGQLLTGLLAGYAFAAWKFPFQRLLYLAVVATWLVPFQVTMLPNYVLLLQLGLLNTLAGVIIPMLCSALGVLLLRQHLKSFPRELLEAAAMDGRSSWTTLWTVVVPNLRSALAALTIVLFVGSWNEYFWPAMVLQRSNAVLQLGLHSFISTDALNWGSVMAVAGLACLPVFILYVVLQRQVVNAFVRSGLR